MNSSLNSAPASVQANLETSKRHERRAVLLLILVFWLVTRAVILMRVWVIEGPAANNDYGITEFLLMQALGTGPIFAIFYTLYLAQRAFRRRPMPLQIAVAVVLSLGGLLAFSLLQYAEANIVGVGGPAETLAFALKYTANYSWAYLPFYTSAILALTYHHDLRLRDQEAFQLEIAAREERLRALRYQVEPHFLFNALNSVSVLLLEQRTPDAQKMVIWLADFFRSSIALSPLSDIALRDELELQRMYIELERVRFEDRLALIVDVPADLESARVPNLILQPLVENAVKHALGRSGSTTTVAIRARAADGTLSLEVEDDGQTATQKAGTGTGLRNVTERLQSLFGAAANLEAGPRADGGFRVRIKIPLRRDRLAPVREEASAI